MKTELILTWVDGTETSEIFDVPAYVTDYDLWFGAVWVDQYTNVVSVRAAYPTELEPVESVKPDGMTGSWVRIDSTPEGDMLDSLMPCPWYFTSTGFIEWAWVNLLGGYRDNHPTPTLLDAVELARSGGYTVTVLFDGEELSSQEE